VIGEPGGDLNYDESIGACQPDQDQDHQEQWTLIADVDYSVQCECALTSWLIGYTNRNVENDAIRASFLIIYK
jgi:hypothetical protein